MIVIFYFDLYDSLKISVSSGKVMPYFKRLPKPTMYKNNRRCLMTVLCCLINLKEDFFTTILFLSQRGKENFILKLWLNGVMHLDDRFNIPISMLLTWAVVNTGLKTNGQLNLDIDISSWRTYLQIQWWQWKRNLKFSIRNPRLLLGFIATSGIEVKSQGEMLLLKTCHHNILKGLSLSVTYYFSLYKIMHADWLPWQQSTWYNPIVLHFYI